MGPIKRIAPYQSSLENAKKFKPISSPKINEVASQKIPTVLTSKMPVNFRYSSLEEAKKFKPVSSSNISEGASQKTLTVQTSNQTMSINFLCCDGPSDSQNPDPVQNDSDRQHCVEVLSAQEHQMLSVDPAVEVRERYGYEIWQEICVLKKSMPHYFELYSATSLFSQWHFRDVITVCGKILQKTTDPLEQTYLNLLQTRAGQICQIEEEIQKGNDLRQILDLYILYLDIVPEREEIIALYKKALNNIKSLDQAASALEQGNFDEAATLARDVLWNYPTNQEAQNILKTIRDQASGKEGTNSSNVNEGGQKIATHTTQLDEPLFSIIACFKQQRFRETITACESFLRSTIPPPEVKERCNQIMQTTEKILSMLEQKVKTGDDIRLIPELCNLYLEIIPDCKETQFQHAKAVNNINILDQAVRAVVQGNFDEAATYARRVLSNYPTNQEAQNLVNFINNLIAQNRTARPPKKRARR
jgi:tetratricopeptide (TPR) repeat protein